MDYLFTIISDAAYGDYNNRTSSQDYIIIIFGGAVNWKAIKQNIIIIFSIKAEFLAIFYVSKELIL